MSLKVKDIEATLSKYEAMLDEELKALPQEEKQKILDILQILFDRYLKLCEEAGLIGIE